MLEKAISDLTEVVKVNNALLSNLVEAKQAKADAASAKAAEKTAEKPAEAAKPADAPKATRSKKNKETDAPKAPTVEDVHEVFSEFLGIDDLEVRAKRKEFVKAILNELGAEKATKIAEEHRAKAIQWVKDKLAGKEVSFDAGEDEGDSLL
jgi:hypothetical protein